MDQAAAVAQIKAVMSAPTEPVPVVVLRASGEAQELTIDQRKVNELLGGVPTIVGGIRSLNLFAAALREQRKGPKNKHKLPDTFDEKIRGDIVLLRTNLDTSSPEPFTLKEFEEWVAAGMPDEAQQEDDEEEGEEIMDEDESDGEEEGEEDDEDEEEEEGEEEEEEGEEEASVNLDDLPVEELRRCAALVRVATTGSKEELLARLKEKLETMNQETTEVKAIYSEGEEGSEEDESEEGSEDESSEDESSDGEEPTLDEIREQTEALSKPQLKEACEQMGLPTTGGRALMVQRIVDAAEKAIEEAKAADMENEENEEESEESEEEEAEEAEEAEEEAVAAAPVRSASKAKGKAKVSPSTGPTKTIAKARKGLRA